MVRISAQSPPFVQQDASHSAALFRQMIAALLGRVQPGTLAYTVGGVVGATDLAVTQHGTANMSVTVAGGFAVIPQTQAANAGLYGGLNDATLNLTVSAANATNPRIDRVVATVLDKAYSGSTTKWTPQVITGTPTSGATLTNLSGAPALPAAAIPLAYVLVPANATSIVTAYIKDVRQVLTRPSTFIGSSAGAPSSGWWPQGASFLDADNVFYVNSGGPGGGTWEPAGQWASVFGVGSAVDGTPPAAKTGRFLIQGGTHVGTTNVNGAFVLTLPTPFPSGILTALVSMGTLAGSYQAQLQAGGASKTALTVYVYNTTTGAHAGTGSAFRINWLAIGF